MTDCVIQPNTLTGSLRPSGLTIGGRITEVLIDDTTWTPLPALPLANRNAMSIQNLSGVQIKINYDPSVVGWVGIKLGIDLERFYDIAETIIIYGKAEPGAGTVTVVVEEIA